MIVARTTTDDRELLIFGLTSANIRHLKDGHPMRITAETHGGGIPDGWTIVLMFGQTEQEIAEVFRREGLMDEHTTVKTFPKRTKEG